MISKLSSKRVNADKQFLAFGESPCCPTPATGRAEGRVHWHRGRESPRGGHRGGQQL